MTAAPVVGFYLHFKPHILMVLAQTGYTFMYIITEASFNHGMNPSVYVTYRHTIAGLVVLPFAYFMERLEIANVRSSRGIAKILGTGVCLAGVTMMALYKGQLQAAYTLKRYPAQLSLTAWMNFVGAAQSAVFTIIVQHKQAAWTIGFNIDFWSTLYGAVVISGIVNYIQLWCTEAKGPVFVTLFNPLSTILVAALAYFVLGENLNIGSIIGGVIVVVGLYLLLWGKEHDESQMKLEKLEDPKVPIAAAEENNLKGEP